ncbi:MAG: aldolase/citrate lyase family protein [Candidatus Roizmanbacteria bacterium]|nr:aldolase/citrate lyase family protein [Candidatus Roizmanbacteria bacterium]
MLKTNWLLDKLRNTSLPCVGTWITLPSPEVVDVICSTGPDFVVIDTEHASITFETAQVMAMACESRQVSPVYRVPAVLDDRIVPALEIGSHAIQAPNIGSPEMARAFVSAARYQPIGSKGLSPYTRACNYSADFAGQMVERANSNTLLIAQIEGREGIENIDAILAVDNIDVCFLGMFDLSNYLGIPGLLNDPRLKELFLYAGMIVGSIANSADQLDFLVKAGVRYITYSADCHVLSKAYREVFSLVQSYQS